MLMGMHILLVLKSGAEIMAEVKQVIHAVEIGNNLLKSREDEAANMTATLKSFEEHNEKKLKPGTQKKSTAVYHDGLVEYRSTTAALCNNCLPSGNLTQSLITV